MTLRSTLVLGLTIVTTALLPTACAPPGCGGDGDGDGDGDDTASGGVGTTGSGGTGDGDGDGNEGGTAGGGAGGLGGDSSMGGTSCFSPENPEAAQGDSVGCECSEVTEGAGVCFEELGMMCLDSQWSTNFEDGVCYPRSDVCGDEFDDATECLLLFTSCQEQMDGSFCGRDPI
jgi:hypothetical protein